MTRAGSFFLHASLDVFCGWRWWLRQKRARREGTRADKQQNAVQVVWPSYGVGVKALASLLGRGLALSGCLAVLAASWGPGPDDFLELSGFRMVW